MAAGARQSRRATSCTRPARPTAPPATACFTTGDALQREAADSYIYDPANPVPTVGGPLCCDAVHLAPGPRDQKEVEARPDVLVYSTPPLEQRPRSYRSCHS